MTGVTLYGVVFPDKPSETMHVGGGRVGIFADLLEHGCGALEFIARRPPLRECAAAPSIMSSGEEVDLRDQNPI